MPRKLPSEKQEHAARLAFWLTEYTRRNPNFRQDCGLYEAQVKLCNELMGWNISPWRQLEFFAARMPENERGHAVILQGCYEAFVSKHSMPPLPPAGPEWSLEILFEVTAGRARKFTKDRTPFIGLLPPGPPDDRPFSLETWREAFQESYKARLERLHDVFGQDKARLGLRQEQEAARAIGLFLFDLVDGEGLSLSSAVYLVQGGIPFGGTPEDQYHGLFPGLRTGGSRGSWDAANNRPWRRLLDGTRDCISARKVLPLTR